MATEAEILCLARTVYGEARSEPDLGKLAVAHVILNRAKHGGWWGSDIISVCLKAKQFSMWNEGDVNRMKAMRADLSGPMFARCFIAALQAVHGLEPDPTNGALWYHSHAVSPSWSIGKHYDSIGQHRFYRPQEGLP